MCVLLSCGSQQQKNAFSQHTPSQHAQAPHLEGDPLGFLDVTEKYWQVGALLGMQRVRVHARPPHARTHAPVCAHAPPVLVARAPASMAGCCSSSGAA